MRTYGRAARPPSLLLVTGCWGAASPLDLVVCSVASGWETRPAVLLLRGVLPRFCTFGCAWLRWGCVGAALCPLQAAGRVPLFQVCRWGPCSRAGLLGGSSIAGPREPRGTLRQGVCAVWAAGLGRGPSPGLEATVVQVRDMTAGCQPFLWLPPGQSLARSDTVTLVWTWSKCWRSSWG